eukprot:s945_g21.t1
MSWMCPTIYQDAPATEVWKGGSSIGSLQVACVVDSRHVLRIARGIVVGYDIRSSYLCHPSNIDWACYLSLSVLISRASTVSGLDLVCLIDLCLLGLAASLCS